MPLLLAAAFIIYILISFTVGFVIAYPVPSLIVIAVLSLAVSIYDFCVAGRRPY